MAPLYISLYGLASILAMIAALIISRRRRRNGQSWAFWSFLFPPLVLVLASLPSRPADATIPSAPHDDDFDPEDDGNDEDRI